MKSLFIAQQCLKIAGLKKSGALFMDESMLFKKFVPLNTELFYFFFICNDIGIKANDFPEKFYLFEIKFLKNFL